MLRLPEIQDFLRMAYKGALESPDPSSQNGALLVRRETNGTTSEVAWGHNHFYPGIEIEVKDRDVKLKRIEHAERDAIFKAAKIGSTQGLIMVCPWSACWDCARAIIGSDLGGLVVHKERQDLTDPRWRDEVTEALQAIERSGILVYEYSGPISAKSILVSGKLWSPERCDYV